MSKYNITREKRRKYKATKQWLYEQAMFDTVTRPKTTITPIYEGEINMGTPMKRTQYEHNELIERVAQLHAQGLGAKEIHLRLGVKYNATYKDIGNILYRYVTSKNAQKEFAQDNKAEAEQQNDMEAAKAAQYSAEMDEEEAQTIANPIYRDALREKPAEEPVKPEPAKTETAKAPDKPRCIMQMDSDGLVKLKCDHVGCRVQIEVTDSEALAHIAPFLRDVFGLIGVRFND